MAPMVAFTSVCNAPACPRCRAACLDRRWLSPIGLQFMGRFGAEETLFALAAELEQDSAVARSTGPARGGLCMKDAMRTVVVGFVAGALSVLVFHQLGFWLSSKPSARASRSHNMRPCRRGACRPSLSLAFWVALWGIAAAFLVPRLPGALSGVLGWMLLPASS